MVEEMKYFVKINIKSIKRNPNAGSTSSKLPTYSSVTLTLQSNGIVELSDIKKIKKLCEKTGFILTYEMENNFIDVTHLPEPDYFYKHSGMKIQCEYCKAEFDASELESDCSDCIDFHISSDTICPKCKKWDCCEIECQTIESLIKEKPEIFRELRNKK